MGRDALAVRAWLRPRLGADGVGGVGLVCRTRSTADAVVAACQGRGIALSRVVVADELGIDIAAGLSYLAMSSETEVIAVESDGLVFPRRVVARIRDATRRRPVVAMTSTGSEAEWCEQAGAEVAHGVDGLVARVGELLLEVRTDRWRAPARGALVEISDCDPSAARVTVDQAASVYPHDNQRSGQLGVQSVRDLLTAYGISSGPGGFDDDASGWNLILEDCPGDGLTAAVSAIGAGSGRRVARLLPLTDRDVEDLACVVAPAAREAVAYMLGRAARLIDDQPEIHRISISPRRPRRATIPRSRSGPVRRRLDRRRPIRPPAAVIIG